MFSYTYLHTQIQVFTRLSQKYRDLHITPGFWQYAANHNYSSIPIAQECLLNLFL
jgi:hypothetical protein